METRNSKLVVDPSNESENTQLVAKSSDLPIISNETNDFDTRLKASLKSKFLVSELNHVAYHDCKDNTVYFYSLSASLIRDRINGPIYNSTDTGDIYGVNCWLNKIPNSSYLLSAQWFQSKIATVVNLNKFNLTSGVKSKPQLQQCLYNNSEDKKITPFAANSRRNVFAMFTEFEKYSFMLWNVRNSKYGESHLQCIKKGKWPILGDNYNFPVRSFGINSDGDRIAMIHGHSLMTVNELDTSVKLIGIKLPEQEYEVNGYLRSFCQWADQKTTTPWLIATLKHQHKIFLVDTEKLVGQTFETKHLIECIDINPMDSNVFVIGTDSGTLLQFDIRTMQKPSVYLFPQPGMPKLNGTHKLQYHANGTRLLYSTGKQIYILEAAHKARPLKLPSSDISDACFF